MRCRSILSGRVLRDWPRRFERWDEWTALQRQHRRDSVTVDSLLMAYRVAVSRGCDPSIEMVRAWRRDQPRIVAERADPMAPWNDELTREAATVWVSGFVYAHLSLGRDRRLSRALGAWITGRPAYNRLWFCRRSDHNRLWV